MDIDTTTRLRRGPATWTMIALAAAVTALPLVSGVTSVLKASGVLGVDPQAAIENGLSAVGIIAEERSLRVAEGFAALVSVPVAITCLLVLYGQVAWKEWAREATLGVFGLSGLFLLVLSLNGLAQGGPRAGLGVVGSLLVLGVAGLAVSPGVRDDFERRRLQRELRAREAASAARRQRLGTPG